MTGHVTSKTCRPPSNQVEMNTAEQRIECAVSAGTLQVWSGRPNNIQVVECGLVGVK